MLPGRAFLFGLTLILIGFAVIFVASIYYALSGGRGNVEAGGVMFIGPIPIVWGTSKWMTRAMMIAGIIIGSLLLLFYILGYLRASRLP